MENNVKSNEYVVKNRRVKDFLFLLGMDFRERKDKTGKQEYIWLFLNTEEFRNALTYYSNFHNQDTHISTITK